MLDWKTELKRMNDRKPGIIRRVFGGLWRLVDGLRRLVLNLIFLAIIAIVVISLLVARGRRYRWIGPGAAACGPGGRAGGDRQTRCACCRAVAAIPNRRRCAICWRPLATLGGFAHQGAGHRNRCDGGHRTVQLQELRLALADFRASGKPIYAWGSRFTQNQYYLASLADEVFMAPDGFVLLQGLRAVSDLLQGCPRQARVKRSGIPASAPGKSAVEPSHPHRHVARGSRIHHGDAAKRMACLANRRDG